MSNQDIQNIYRFLAAQSTAVEHFRYCKGALMELDLQLMAKQIETRKEKALSRAARRELDRIEEHYKAEIKRKYDGFEKRIEDLISQFEKDQDSLPIIDRMIDALTEKLQEIEVVLTNEA